MSIIDKPHIKADEVFDEVQSRLGLGAKHFKPYVRDGGGGRAVFVYLLREKLGWNYTQIRKTMQWKTKTTAYVVLRRLKQGDFDRENNFGDMTAIEWAEELWGKMVKDRNNG
jgi:hypothetical protein